ncbi:MAG: fructose-1,6-bisphosphatase [Lachnospiraceae bacterium]|nr:fructose-1,6-bisphosphatase [Lachnospiraceae bacterium]
MKEPDMKYLKLLALQYPTIAKASTEIINLTSILNLPKGTEHMLSDIHGEGEHFFHVLKNGSGAIRTKIDDEFGNTISNKDKKQLATLIYYPEEKLALIEKEESDIDDWYKVTLNHLIRICKRSASKYTRSKVRKALPADFAYVIDELINEKEEFMDKEAYYNQIIETIISTGRAKEFISAICNVIQRFVIDHLHIVGDIFDRGPNSAAIMDRLLNYHSVDIQWGNHDILWMGAAMGHPVCIANVIRISARYGNMDTLEEDYGINMLPFATFARSTYENDDCKVFRLHRDKDEVSRVSVDLEMKMHKAMSIIQFKLEGQLIKRHPEFGMKDRLLLDKINFENNTVKVGNKWYPLLDTNFPTIDPADPYKLTDEEQSIVDHLVQAFKNSEKMQRHASFLFEKGSLYLTYNLNLFYHGCVPFNEDGTFREVSFGKESFKGKALYDYIETWARKGYYLPENDPDKEYGMDIAWFTWQSPNSPLFGKEKMATFERYFIEDEATHKEAKNPYYKLIDREDICDMIIREFGLDPETAHIINGHMPVKSKKGENPIKGNGKLVIIDGGFAKAYQSTTGIAGYTLIYNSFCLRLVTHNKFESKEKAIMEETDIRSNSTIVKSFPIRLRVADTDNGKFLQESVDDLICLLQAYRSGKIREKR